MSYQVDRQKWSNMDIFEQMGNIGSEVGRSIRAKKSGDEAMFNAALARTLDLFDATVEDLVAHKSGRGKEVLRARDQYLSLFYDPKFGAKERALEAYFTQFAIAARLQR